MGAKEPEMKFATRKLVFNTKQIMQRRSDSPEKGVFLLAYLTTELLQGLLIHVKPFEHLKYTKHSYIYHLA